jgi:hypothetical protein
MRRGLPIDFPSGFSQSLVDPLGSVMALLGELRSSLDYLDYSGAWNKRRNSTHIYMANAIPFTTNALIELF